MTIIIVAMTTGSPNRQQFPLYLGQNSTPHANRDLCYSEGKTVFDGQWVFFFEIDSPVMALLLLAVVFLIFLGGVLGLAYMGGVFTGKNEVIANDKRIANAASLTTQPR